MSEKKIKGLYQKKIKLLQKHNLLYYDKSNPKISDKDYDNLKQEILKLEKQYDFLNDSNSPSKTVGFLTSTFQKCVRVVRKYTSRNSAPDPAETQHPVQNRPWVPHAGGQDDGSFT